jgi:catechol 2,3-dioxygenase-like lactoylglutathione lyase family enzyme
VTEGSDSHIGNVIHHTALRVSDVEQSLRFYRDGLGMEITVEGEFEGPWRRLFGVPTDTLRMTMLGDPASPGAGTVELVRSDDGDSGEVATQQAAGGFLLISLYCDVDVTLARLADLGFTQHERAEIPGERGPVVMASIRDPDGVLVELVDQAAGAQITG